MAVRPVRVQLYAASNALGRAIVIVQLEIRAPEPEVCGRARGLAGHSRLEQGDDILIMPGVELAPGTFDGFRDRFVGITTVRVRAQQHCRSRPEKDKGHDHRDNIFEPCCQNPTAERSMHCYPSYRNDRQLAAEPLKPAPPSPA